MLIRYLRSRIQRSRQRQLEQERVLGRVEGVAELLTRQLELKFGALPEPYEEQIRQADELLLMRWSERVLMAVTLPAVFEGRV